MSKEECWSATSRKNDNLCGTQENLTQMLEKRLFSSDYHQRSTQITTTNAWHDNWHRFANNMRRKRFMPKVIWIQRFVSVWPICLTQMIKAFWIQGFASIGRCDPTQIIRLEQIGRKWTNYLHHMCLMCDANPCIRRFASDHLGPSDADDWPT